MQLIWTATNTTNEQNVDQFCPVQDMYIIYDHCRNINEVEVFKVGVGIHHYEVHS